MKYSVVAGIVVLIMQNWSSYLQGWTIWRSRNHYQEGNLSRVHKRVTEYFPWHSLTYRVFSTNTTQKKVIRCVPSEHPGSLRFTGWLSVYTTKLVAPTDFLCGCNGRINVTEFCTALHPVILTTYNGGWTLCPPDC